MTKWYGLNQDGDMIYLGEFEDFTIADESCKTSMVWIADEETARTWLAQLKELLLSSTKENQP